MLYFVLSTTTQSTERASAGLGSAATSACATVTALRQRSVQRRNDRGAIGLPGQGCMTLSSRSPAKDVSPDQVARPPFSTLVGFGTTRQNFTVGSWLAILLRRTTNLNSYLET
jgi:hypothetical protein